MKPTYIKELNADVIVEIVKKEDVNIPEGFKAVKRWEQLCVLDNYTEIRKLTYFWWYHDNNSELCASRLISFDYDSGFIANGRDVDYSYGALRGVMYIKRRVGK